jgi:three-Cys-motif partner protein
LSPSGHRGPQPVGSKGGLGYELGDVVARNEGSEDDFGSAARGRGQPSVVDSAACLRAMAVAAKDDHPESEDDPVETRAQTEAKLELLGEYFAAWPNAILNGLAKRQRGPLRADLWFIDLFAGRGWHESANSPNGRLPGTPAMAAFRFWQALQQPGHEHVTGHVVAIDSDAEFAAPLKAIKSQFEIPGQLEIRVETANCAELIAPLRAASRSGYSLWLFDPYGLRSIPFALFSQLSGRQPRTELLINLEVGGATRVVDAVAKTGRLTAATGGTLDCLFGDHRWAAIPPELTQTGDRERWLVDCYKERMADVGPLTAAYPLRGGKHYRAVVQVANHQTAISTLERVHGQVTRLWKTRRPLSVKELGQRLARELAGQTITPRQIYELGVLPPDVGPTRIDHACDSAMQDGLGDRTKNGVDQPIMFVNDPATARSPGLFD